MKYGTLMLASGLAVAAASQAVAFDHKRTEFSLGYENYSIQGQSFDGPSVGVKSDFGLSPNFGVQVNLTYGEQSIGPATLDRTTFGLHPYYEFTNGNRAGAFVQYTDFGIDLSPVDLSATYYGIEGIVNPLPSLALEGYLGLGQLDTGGSNIDIQTLGMQVTYGFTPNLAGRFSTDFDMIDTGSTDIQIDSYTLGLDYYISGGGSGIPMILIAELGRESFTSVAIDRAAISLTIPLGGGTDTSSRKLYRNRGVLSQFFPAF